MPENRTTQNVVKSGETTRLINRTIEELFSNVFTKKKKKKTGVPQMIQNRDAMDRFKKRMKSEHKNIKFSHKYGIFENIKCFKIQLIT